MANDAIVQRTERIDEFEATTVAHVHAHATNDGMQGHIATDQTNQVNESDASVQRAQFIDESEAATVANATYTGTRGNIAMTHTDQESAESEVMTSEVIVLQDSDEEENISITFRGKFPVPIQSAIASSDFVKHEHDRISGDMLFKEDEVSKLRLNCIFKLKSQL